jgi:hypothetical protein
MGELTYTINTEHLKRRDHVGDLVTDDSIVLFVYSLKLSATKEPQGGWSVMN